MYRMLLSNGKDGEFDDDYGVEGELTFRYCSTDSLLKFEGQEYYGSDFSYMINVIHEITYRNKVLYPIAYSNKWYRAEEHPEMSDKELELENDSRMLEAMRYNWENAASLMKCRRLESLTQSRLRKRLIGIGRRDYEDRRKLRATAFRYPELKDILRQIGREREAGTEEKDITELVDIPILLRHSSSKQEIDGVTVGNNLPNLLPSEYALMDEPVFFKKYVDRQLQQFRSKPPTVFKQKTEKIRRPEPRLESGPIILAIDTSLSMAGRPLDISHALLTQIIYLTRKQRRKCFLINFSVRARYMEISRPGQYAKVEKFFSKRLTGGTDGEEMLKASFKALQKDSFSMADILIISDFIFPIPKKATAAKIQEEKLRGTRFYGLHIGSGNSGPGGYDRILDKYWKISV